ncbi:GNAT family N-acetyltransferase [Hanstruepera marina]|uniref:GNAT family N-acetyltransferase n=1 Tax=Hanstruepera marina TaxID=2873265 RepID=UPI001CA65F6A|nr:GNAT family N-acetyltransferase [Hanstruepera marina]
MKFQILNTARLQLRPLTIEDAPQIQFLRSNAIVNQFVKRQKTETIEDALNFIKRISSSVSKQEVYYWSITLKNNPELKGTICLWNFSKDLKTAEVGYDLHPDLHGQGIMNESLTAVVNYGFKTLNLDTIEAYTQQDNLSSVYLLKKLGFQHQPNRIDEENVKNMIFVLENKA